MSLQEQNSIVIEKSKIICSSDADPVYRLCKREHILTEEELLALYATGANLCKQKRSRLQLDGVVNLLNYQRESILSTEFLSILNQPVPFDNFYGSLYRLEIFSRLGLFDTQRKFLSSWCIKNNNHNQFIHFIKVAYEKLVQSPYPFFNKREYKNTLYKFDLMLSMFRDYYGEEPESFINNRKKVVQDEFARIRSEAKLTKGRQI